MSMAVYSWHCILCRNPHAGSLLNVNHSGLEAEAGGGLLICWRPPYGGAALFGAVEVNAPTVDADRRAGLFGEGFRHFQVLVFHFRMRVVSLGGINSIGTGNLCGFSLTAAADKCKNRFDVRPLRDYFDSI